MFSLCPLTALFTLTLVRERLSVDLLDNMKAWIEERNALIHNLANIPYDSENVRKIAEDGESLLRVFKNKSASVINRFKKSGIIQK